MWSEKESGSHEPADAQSPTIPPSTIPVEREPFDPRAWLQTIVLVLSQPTKTFETIQPKHSPVPALVFAIVLAIIARLAIEFYQLMGMPYSQLGVIISLPFVLPGTAFLTSLELVLRTGVVTLLFHGLAIKECDFITTFRVLALLLGPVHLASLIWPPLAPYILLFLFTTLAAIALASAHRIAVRDALIASAVSSLLIFGLPCLRPDFSGGRL